MEITYPLVSPSVVRDGSKFWRSVGVPVPEGNVEDDGVGGGGGGGGVPCAGAQIVRRGCQSVMPSAQARSP